MAKEIKINTRESVISSRVGSKNISAPYGWFRGENMSFYPNKDSLHDLSEITDLFLGNRIFGKLPIKDETIVTTFGSCFASHIANWFSCKNIGNSISDAYVIRFNEGFVNTYTILQQFEWALENKIPKTGLWFDAEGNILEYDEKIRNETCEIFRNTDVFIITLGLSEVWYDKHTDEVFWRAVPRRHYDADRHKFRQTTVEQNYNNLKSICRLINNSVGDAKIVFTLSPVPLISTFRSVPIVQANTVSKSILRVAVESLIDQNLFKNLFYWPSYEIINTFFLDPFLDDCRHIRSEILNFNMALFDYYACRGINYEELCKFHEKAKL